MRKIKRIVMNGESIFAERGQQFESLTGPDIMSYKNGWLTLTDDIGHVIKQYNLRFVREIEYEEED